MSADRGAANKTLKLLRNQTSVTIKSEALRIARAANTMKPIAEVAAKVGIPADATVPYGAQYQARKVSFRHIDSLQGRQGRQADPGHRHQPDALPAKARRRRRSASARRPQPHRRRRR